MNNFESLCTIMRQNTNIRTLSKNINPSLVLVQPRKTRPFITERLLMGRKESNQTNTHKNINFFLSLLCWAVINPKSHPMVIPNGILTCDVVLC